MGKKDGRSDHDCGTVVGDETICIYDKHFRISRVTGNPLWVYREWSENEKTSSENTLSI